LVLVLIRNKITWCSTTWKT